MDIKKFSKYQLVEGQQGSLEGEPWTRSRTEVRLGLFPIDNLDKGRSILDLGCNNGQMCFWARKLTSGRVVGVDTSDAILEARKMAKEKNMKIEFWQQDIESREFKQHCPKFDIIFMFSMLNHLKDPEGMIKWIDEHTNFFFFFETNCGKKSASQINLIREWSSFHNFRYLGLSEIPKHPHYLWQCCKSKTDRKKKHWRNLPVSFIPVNEVYGWELENLNDYSPDKERYKRLKANIIRNGMRAPIVVRKTEKGYEKLEGGHRWFIAKELGWKSIPAKVKDF